MLAKGDTGPISRMGSFKHGSRETTTVGRGSPSLHGRLFHGREEGNLLALHPTVKPVAMVADAILDCSARGDIVLDGFLGSGTTVIAAERAGRRCYGLELDPLYVDTIVRRWQTLTGGSAIHLGSGRRFDELADKVEVADAT